MAVSSRQEYQRQYYRENHDQIRAKQRAYRTQNIDKLRANDRESYHRQYWAWRREIFQRLGEKCCRCGFSDSRALQIDHKNGGGSREWKARGWKHLRTILENLNDYQILCANCNWIKRHERGEVNTRKY